MSKQPLDRLRSRKKPVSRRIPIVTDSDLAEEMERTRVEAVAARERSDRTPGDERLRALADEADIDAETAHDAALESAVWFVAHSLSPRVFEELCNQHPPTPDQIKDARKLLGNQFARLRWNVETFQPSLIEACVSFVERDDESGEETITPLDEAFVKEMYEGEDWNSAELGALFDLALEVNSKRRVVEAGKGSRLTRN